MADERTLTRREAKAVTRQRLLDAALEILDEDGEAALTTTAVTRGAGIAQSSFYVHFADIDDLLQSLIDELAANRRRETRIARVAARATPFEVERLRETFRIPINDLVAHPQLFRLVMRSRHDRTSALGEWSRSLHEDSRAALVEDLVAAGLPSATSSDRRKAEMIADGIIALTETLAAGHLEGRYRDVEEMIDVLIAFSKGYFTLIPRRGGRS